MGSNSILAEFAEKGVELWEDNGKLRYRVRKGQDTGDILIRISDKMPQILSAIRSRKESGGGVSQMLMPDLENRHKPFPVTGLQSAYLLGRQDFFDLGNLSCQAYFEFEGQGLCTQRLSMAWRALIQRHEMLRAVFDEEGSQRILEEVPLYEIPELDLRGLSPGQQNKMLADLRKTMSCQVMNPERWPLFDLKAVFMEGNKVRLVISIDMLVADFFSIRILFMELFALYNSPQLSLPPLSVSFRDYVMAMETIKESAQYQQARAYWMERLPTLPPAPMLPLATNPSTIQAPSFSRYSFVLEPEDWSALKRQAKVHGVTPSAALLTAYADVLGAWSNQKHFSLNLTVLNRLPVHPKIMDVVGDFTTVNLLEVDMRERKTFCNRAANIQAQLWRDLEHRYFDGVNVLRELSGSGKEQISMPIVFTSTIGVGEAESGSHGFGIGNMTYSITQTPQVWLDFQLGELNGALLLAWDYVEGLFPESMLKAMFASFKARVHDLAHKQNAWTVNAPVPVPQEQLAVRNSVNNTEAKTEERLLHELFEDRAAAYPDHVAIRNGPVTMTYRELSQQSDSLAWLLRRKGVVRGCHVAVVMEKGWEQVVGVMGVLKAGGAYLPVDPATPELRLRHLLDHGNASLVLTQTKLQARIPEHVATIAVDTLPHEQEHTIQCSVKKEDLAYIIYTSGSTGEPKGVMVDHVSVLNTIFDINNRFHVKPDDVVLGLSNLNFDLSVYDIFGTLAAGATLVLPEAGREKESGYLLHLMQEEKVTVWNSVPAFMEMLLHEARGADDPAFKALSLRLALLSGDYLPTQLASKVHSLFDRVDCVSLGGATEASIWSICHPVRPEDCDSCSIPYGRPLANQRFHVLNSEMEHCPDWVVGDLYIAGAGLARGYWADEDKTRQAFFPHPITGERLYRTGDLGFYRSNGDIIFAGRKDSQVKMRGHRIELGEIEATIRRYPGVSDVVVTVAESTNSKQLAAYVVADKGQEDHISEEQTAETTASYKALVRSATEKGEDILASFDRAALSAFGRWIERATAVEVANVCKVMGLFAHMGEPVTPDDLTRTYGVLPEYLPLVRQWFILLARNGLLQNETGEAFTRVVPFPECSPESLADEFEQISRLEPHVRTTAGIVRACAGHARDIITGAADPAEVFFQKSAFLSPAALNRSMPGATEIAAALKTALMAFIQARERATNVLEIGAVSAADTRALVGGLDREVVSYTVSVASPFFLRGMQEELRDIPSLEHALFNTERDPGEQGLSVCEFDVVIGCNSLHRSKNIPGLLKRLHGLLAPGGVLLFSEGIVNTSLQLLTAGLLERGFEDFTDERAGSNAPLLSASRWKTLLEQAGFVDAGFCPAHEEIGQGCEQGDEKGIGQAVFFARRPNVGALPDLGMLHDFLKQRLPGYMLPGGYSFIDAIPLSPNGKVDRKRLPACSAAVSRHTSPQVPPATETEALLAKIWCQILSVESVGVHENFFALGGDSLLANTLATQLTKRTGVRVPLGTVFEQSTIFALGRYIDENRQSQEQQPAREEGVI